MVEPTPLKNMLVKLNHFSRDWGENKKSLKPPPRTHFPANYIVVVKDYCSFWRPAMFPQKARPRSWQEDYGGWGTHPVDLSQILKLLNFNRHIFTKSSNDQHDFWVKNTFWISQVFEFNSWNIHTNPQKNNNDLARPQWGHCLTIFTKQPCILCCVFFFPPKLSQDWLQLGAVVSDWF